MELSKEKTKYRPVKGKTYSLFGQCDGTEEYYALIKRLAGRFLK